MTYFSVRFLCNFSGFNSEKLTKRENETKSKNHGEGLQGAL